MQTFVLKTGFKMAGG